MFPLNILSCMEKRKARRFKENHANTERYLKSSIPYMQSLLNKELCHNDSITTDNLI